MKVFSAIIAHPLRKVSGATSAGRELSIATAKLTGLDLAIMWDRDEVVTVQGMTEYHLRCWNRLGPFESAVPRFVRVPLYDSRLPEMAVEGGYDLVHFHNLIPTFAAERLAKACQRNGIPYVVSTHGFYELSHYAEINEFGPLRSGLVKFAITRPFERIVRKAAGIFALSDCDTEVLVAMGVDNNKIHMVTNGVNEFYLEPPTSAELGTVRSKFQIGSDPVLLFMGSLHAYKGVGVFLRSLRDIRFPFQAVVAGRFKDDAERAALLQAANLDAQLAERVTFTGAISDTDLRALYHSSSLFVYPTMGDTLPLVVLEAMACRRPVISTTVGGIPFAVRRDCGVLVSPGDSSAVAREVNQLLSSPERRKTMGDRARVRIEETFRWSAAARCAVEGYQKVLSRAASSSAAA